jgi:hypothetical protein
MLGRLIHKEILDQILSLRFVILAAIGAFTIWLSLYDGYANYQARLKDYHTARTMTEERLRQYQNVDGFTYRPLWEFSGVGFEEHKPPTPLSIFARGLEMTLGRSIPTGYTKQQRLRQSPVEAEPTLGVFPPLDLGLVLLLFGVYLGVMVLAGVAASSISYKSATSFILLLTFWVVTVVVMPRISLIVADGILPAPSTHEFQAKQKAMQRQTMLKRRAKLREWEGGWKNWWESPEGR